jgi:hypothetical protein
VWLIAADNVDHDYQSMPAIPIILRSSDDLLRGLTPVVPSIAA